MKSLPDSYNFMFKLHGKFEHGQFNVPPIQWGFDWVKFKVSLIQSIILNFVVIQSLLIEFSCNSNTLYSNFVFEIYILIRLCQLY